MPGVFRPYTLVDILGTMNDQSTQQTANDVTDGVGDFGETNETFSVGESVTGSVVVLSQVFWDNATWGTFTWT